MFESYVYRNLKKYGNCIISKSDYKRYGKNKILKELKENGFNCNIRIIKSKEGKTNDPLRMSCYMEETIILEVK